MKSASSNSHLAFVVSHGPSPQFPLHENTYLVWLSADSSPANLPNPILRAYDMFDDPEEMHRRLSGSLGTLAIFRHLQAMEKRPETISVASYRKFNSTRKFGLPHWHFRKIPASTYLGMQIIDVSAPERLEPFPPAENKPFVLSAPRRFESIISQFSENHPLDYLLLMLAAGMRCSSFTAAEARSLLGGQTFIPGGLELGTFPVSFWMEATDRMMKATDYFFDNYHRDDGRGLAQYREVSYVLERFGSFLILDHLEQLRNLGEDTSSLFGYVHTVFPTKLERRSFFDRNFLRQKLRLKRYT